MRRRGPTALLLLLVLASGAAFLVWRFLGERNPVGLDRTMHVPAASAAASASDARPDGVEDGIAARSADASASPPTASDVAIDPTPEHGVPVVVVARGSGEPQPFALVTRIESPWDDRADAHSHRDLGWLLDHLGRRYRADERGFVRIPPSAGHLELFARAGALAGYASLAPGEVKASDDAPPKRIEVAPFADLRLRVVDQEGHPVAGVPLQVIGEGGGRTIPATLGDCESTAPDGLAEVAGASLLIDDGAPPGGLLVCVQLPLRRPVSLRVARTELDGKPRTLVVPAMGSVELVLVDAHGNVPAIDDDGSWVALLRGRRRGTMTTEEQKLKIGDELRVNFHTGRAQIPFVELGDWIEADLDFGAQGRRYVQAAGPTIAGTTVRIDVPLEANAGVVAIRGRVVDPDGRPIAGRELRASYLLTSEKRTDRGDESTRTRADGSFEFPVRGPDGMLPPLPVWSSMKLVLAFERPDGGYEFDRRTELDGEFACRGGDLGTIVLARAPLLASGVVVDEAGAPAEHVGLHVMQKNAADPRFRMPSNPSDYDTIRADLATRSRADGTFAIFGDPGRGSFGLDVDHDDYLSPPTIPIEPGVTGLRIVVSRPAALLAHVLLDPGLPPNFVLGRVRVPRPGEAGDDDEQWHSLDERGDLLFERLPPRPAEVEIRADCFGSPQELIARFDSITLTAGERIVDPRLQAIDLRGRFQSTHVVVVDPDGEPVRNVVVRLDADPSGDAGADGSERQATQEFELGVGDLVTLGALPPIVVEAKGFRTQRAELTRPQTRITLRRGFEVVVALDPSLPVLPESCFYAITLTPGSFEENAGVASDFVIVHDPAHSMRVERPGDCSVQLWVARYFKRTSFGMNELKSARARIRVEDSETPTKIQLTATPADVKATLADLGL